MPERNFCSVFTVKKDLQEGLEGRREGLEFDIGYGWKQRNIMNLDMFHQNLKQSLRGVKE